MKNEHDSIKTLKALREENQLTQDELAKKLGVSKSTIAYYESGDRLPTLERFVKIAGIFGVDLNTLGKAFDLIPSSSIPDDISQE